MAEFLDEVREELKREKLETLVKKYGKLLIALVIFAAVGATFFTWYTENAHKKRQEAGAEYSNAFRSMVNGDENAIDQLTKVIEQSPNGYKQLAAIKLAFLKAKKGEVDDAVKQLDAISNDSAAERAIREIAELYAAIVLVENSPDNDSITARLSKLTDKTNIWHSSAKELQAVYFMKKGDNAKAVETFSALMQDSNTPPQMRERAEKMISILKGVS